VLLGFVRWRPPLLLSVNRDIRPSLATPFRGRGRTRSFPQPLPLAAPVDGG